MFWPLKSIIMDVCLLVSRRRGLHIHTGIWTSLISEWLSLFIFLIAIPARARIVSKSSKMPSIIHLDIFEFAFSLKVVIWIDFRALLISSSKIMALVELESVGVCRTIVFLPTPFAVINLKRPLSFWLIVKSILLSMVTFGKLATFVIEI